MIPLPWAPIYTVTRSELPEVTIHGIAYAWAEDKSLYANAGRALVKIGDSRAALWTRSLLKPWQFMVIYPQLKKAYPQLTARQYAMMLASHQADAAQVKLLDELLATGQLSVNDLQCPACHPMTSGHLHTTGTGVEPSPLNNACAGKHLGHLLWFKSKGEPLEHYLSHSAEPYMLVKELLAFLTGQEPGSIQATVDGCGMPNFNLSAADMAHLYHALVMPASSDLVRQAPEELEEALSCWNEIATIMREFPEIIGGVGRLDTRLMQASWQSDPHLKVIAKEGADGLLAIGIGPNTVYPDGLGILIKLASGYHAGQLETIAFGILETLGLKPKSAEPENEILHTIFHFAHEPASAPSASPGKPN